MLATVRRKGPRMAQGQATMVTGVSSSSPREVSSGLRGWQLRPVGNTKV